MPPFFANMGWAKAINAWATGTIPLFAQGLDFFPFLLIGLLGSWAIAKIFNIAPAATLSNNNR